MFVKSLATFQRPFCCLQKEAYENFYLLDINAVIVGTNHFGAYARRNYCSNIKPKHCNSHRITKLIAHLQPSFIQALIYDFSSVKRLFFPSLYSFFLYTGEIPKPTLVVKRGPTSVGSYSYNAYFNLIWIHRL